MENPFVLLFVELRPEVVLGGVRLQVNIFDELTVSIVDRGRGSLNQVWFPILLNPKISSFRENSTMYCTSQGYERMSWMDP